MAKHFEFRRASGPKDSPLMLSYVLTYSGVQAHTRTAGADEGGGFSGIARIASDGSVQSYFGPQKKYEMKISKDEAQRIMKGHGCVLPEDNYTGPPTAKPAGMRLFIGDYFEKTGKYKPDFIEEGFYWLGGKPGEGQEGSVCRVDAETGKFGIRFYAPH